MKRCLKRFKEVPASECTARVRLGFIREPFDRLESCYSFFYWHHKNDTLSHKDPMYPYISDYEKFIDHMLAGEFPNNHWRPQTDLFPNLTVTHKFEEYTTRWGDYFPGFLPDIVNRSTHLETSDYRVTDLEAYYRKDLDLWHSL